MQPDKRPISKVEEALRHLSGNEAADALLQQREEVAGNIVCVLQRAGLLKGTDDYLEREGRDEKRFAIAKEAEDIIVSNAFNSSVSVQQFKNSISEMSSCFPTSVCIEIIQKTRGRIENGIDIHMERIEFAISIQQLEDAIDPLGETEGAKQWLEKVRHALLLREGQILEEIDKAVQFFRHQEKNREARARKRADEREEIRLFEEFNQPVVEQITAKARLTIHEKKSDPLLTLSVDLGEFVFTYIGTREQLFASGWAIGEKWDLADARQFGDLFIQSSEQKVSALKLQNNRVIPNIGMEPSTIFKHDFKRNI